LGFGLMGIVARGADRTSNRTEDDGGPPIHTFPGTTSVVLDASAGEDDYRRVFYEGFASTGSLPRDVWLLGSRGDGEGQLKSDEYHLCNRSGTDTASYTSKFAYIEDDHRPDQSNAIVEMTVKLEPPLSNHAAAGILFRASQDSYYALALSAGHSVVLVHATGIKLKIMSTWGMNGIKDGDAVRLKVQGADGELRLFVNDKTLKPEHLEDGARGDPGVFAMGRGCFDFDDVSLYLPTK
jgi:hypothetical protein